MMELMPRVGLGNIMVMSFFVLSGFVITEAVTTFYWRRPWSFLANRLVRLAPPYWAALLLSLIAHFAIFSSGLLKLPDYSVAPAEMFDPVNLAANVFAIFPRPGFLNIVPENGFYGFVRFYWAIYIEFAFYLAAFSLVFVIALAEGLRKRARSLAIVGVAGALALHAIHEYVRPVHWEFAYAPYFVAGACIFAWSKHRDYLALTGLIAAYAFIFVHFARYAQGKMPLSENWIVGIAQPHVAIALILMLAMPLVTFWLASLNSNHRMRDWDRRLGDFSYPIYLNHYVVLIVFNSLAPNRSFFWQVSALISSIAVSWALMLMVERPMVKIRNRLRGQALRV
jgi:peptidoglycan/LPS O-acetylase OafA/YrhL